MNGRASACQVYPRKFCAEICPGLKDELARLKVAADEADRAAQADANVLVQQLAASRAELSAEQERFESALAQRDESAAAAAEAETRARAESEREALTAGTAAAEARAN